MQKHFLEGSKVWFDEEIYSFYDEIINSEDSSSKYIFINSKECRIRLTLDEIISYNIQAIHPLSPYDAINDLAVGDKIIVGYNEDEAKIRTVRKIDYTDEIFAIAEDNNVLYAVGLCIGKIIPLADYFVEDTKPNQCQTITAEYPTFEHIKTTSIDTPQPKFGLYAATDQDIINFITQKEKLYTFDSDGSIMEINYNDEIIFLMDHYEENELYTLKPY